MQKKGLNKKIENETTKEQKKEWKTDLRCLSKNIMTNYKFGMTQEFNSTLKYCSVITIAFVIIT